MAADHVRFRRTEGLLRESLHRQAVVAEDIGLAPGDGVLVRNAGDVKRHTHAGLHQQRGAGFAQAAVDRVLFRGDDRAALAAGFEHGFGVQRFDRMQAQHASAQPMVGQPASGQQGMDDCLSGGDESDIVAGAELNGFAHLELCAGRVKGIRGRFAETEVNGPVGARGGADGLPCLEIVSRSDEGQVVNRAQSRKSCREWWVLPRATIADAGADADEPDRDIRVTDIVLDLFERPCRKKTGRRNREYLLARSRKPCRDTDQILLSHTNLDELFREALAKRAQLARAAGIAGNHD